MTTPTTSPAAPAAPRELAAIEADLQAHADGLHTGGESLDLDTPPASTSSPDVEAEARRKGWRPRDEFDGPQSRWVDAQTFIERGENFNKNLQAQVAQLRQQVADFEGTKAAFSKFLSERLAERDRDHAAAIRALKTQRLQAIREGEDDAALEIEDRIAAAQEAQAAFKAEAAEMAPAPAAKPTPKTPEEEAAEALANPVLIEWMEDGNQWFREQPDLQRYAIEVGKQLRAQGTTAVGRKFLELVEARVRADFPRRFRAIAGTRQVPTGGTQSSSGAPSSAGYNGKTRRDLPPADRALMDQFVKDGLYTEEQFLKSYFTRNA